MDKPKNNFFFKKPLLCFLFLFLSFVLIFPQETKAEGAPVFDAAAILQRTTEMGLELSGQTKEALANTKDSLWDKLKEQLKKVGSVALQSAIQTALNTLAYDTATWIGSGADGQKPLFTTEYLTKLGTNAANSATSKFIQGLSKEWSVDLCRPTADRQANIGFGLVQFQQPNTANLDCSFQELQQKFTSEIEKYKAISKDPGAYVKAVSGMFDATSNDIGVSLSLYAKMDEEGKKEKTKLEEQIKLNEGWLDVRNIGGSSKTPPGQGQRELQKADATQVAGLGKFTGNALIDATNVFVNQLAISAFNKYIRGGGLVDLFSKDDESSPANKLTSYSSDPGSYSGQSSMAESLKKVIKPRFNVQADYDVLSSLTVCLDEDKPMPNNCVITDQFSQAIQKQSSLINAIEEGYINSSWLFDKNASYKTAFNERSLMILRKFRIIPLGWEEALNRAEAQTALKGFRYTLMDMISCFDPSDEYNEFSEGFRRSNFTNASWCQGLVDPTWVLKAPLNYCKKQGYGGYILSQQLIDVPEVKGVDSSDVEIEPIVISRSDDYCADEQSCIKERYDGTCEYYGYCTEEKRVWNFDQDSCDPVYNTCDSFTSGSNGKKLALLKNTIDYSSCSADNVGCSKYATMGTYLTDTKKVSWNNVNSIYLNNKAESCSASSEGCQELIRTFGGSGHNFLINGDFEEALSVGSWESAQTGLTSPAYDGASALELNGVLSKNVTVASSDHVIAGESYTLSFYADCLATSTVSLGAKTQDIITPNGFAYQAINYTYPSNFTTNQVSFVITPGGSNTCLIDNIKLERGTSGTFYSDYRGNGLTYQKIIPDYLKLACYENPSAANPDFRLKSNAPSECYNYARLCNSSEIGCDLFTSIYGTKTAAKALEKDYCPGECVGYDVYVQGNTLFEGKTPAKMIPESATYCSAINVGCTEFTNLDELSAGGEAKEYYSSLKHCIKPSQGTCENFYSWEGSDESGYQLKSFSLERSNADTIPKLVNQASLSSSVNSSGVTVWQESINSNVVCSSDIYNLPVSSPNYNSDCREFYNQAGDIIYVLTSSVITCSDNCKTYRMTEKNINTDLNASTCSGDTRHWDSGSNTCFECLSNGKWDNTQGSCIYQAIPGEGKVCSSASNGCREYNGNSGNNVQIINSYNFNSGLGDWTGDVAPSTESLNQGGKSMAVLGTASVRVGNLFAEGSSYVIKFLAKASEDKNLAISIENGSGATNYFGITGENQSGIVIPASSDWQTYQVSLDRVSHNVDNNEKLKIISSPLDSDIFISNIIIIEVTDRYYLIKNSWKTPEVCYYDTLNNYRGVNYNLGCQIYKDNSSASHNLRQFSKLCSDSAVGCQMMIKTNNYNSPNAGIFNDTNSNGACDTDEQDCVYVPADKFVPVVYDASKACNQSNMGCSLLGKLVSANPYMVSQNIYQDIYLKNNPNNYNTSLCSQTEVGCDSWTSSADSGISYFKDPGNNLCEWRKGNSTASNFAWYKKAVKKCKAGNTFTSNICLSASDCSASQTCDLDTGDYLCPVDSLKTIGYGGASAVYQPGEQFGVKWAGLCPINQAGCSEYVDPISSFSPNIILNPTFSDLDGDGERFDMWTQIGGTCSSDGHGGEIICGSGISFAQTDFEILPNKLYVLETKGSQSAVLNCAQPIYKLDTNNTLSPISNKTIIVGGNNNTKATFYSASNSSSCSVTYKGDTFQPSYSLDDAFIELRGAIVDYQFKQNLDFSSCNGNADFANGCIIFNERYFKGSDGLTALNYNSLNYSNYSSCSGASCDANTLIKVKPDRVCGRWLSCFSYNIDPTTGEKNCSEMKECTSFDYDGSCLNFSKSPDGDRKYISGRDNNASGYSVLGMDYLANMQQVGRDVSFYDNFEAKNVGKWYRNYSVYNTETSSMQSLINQPLATGACLINKPNSSLLNGKKVTYPASGTSFLQIGGPDCSGYFTSIEKLSLPKSTDYYLSMMVNTADLQGEEKGRVKIIGYEPGDSVDWGLVDDSYTYLIDKKNGWQEVTFKFTTDATWDNGVRILLEASSNNPIYYDEVRITPVLQVKKNTFTSSICRLYPTQESLFCESENENFVANGWYGYCLQKDPKNENVCLLWYPIDYIKGERGSSGASSAFSGYAETGGSRPYYCAEMSADFDLVYKVEPFYSGVVHISKTNDTNKAYWFYNGTETTSFIEWSSLPLSVKCNINDKEGQTTGAYFYWRLGQYAYSGDPYFPTAEYCTGSCNYPSSGVYKSCGEATDDKSYRYNRFICSMGLTRTNSLTSFSGAIALGDKKNFGGDMSRIVVNGSTSCNYKLNATTDFELDTLWAKWSSSAQSTFNAQQNSSKPALDIRVMAYDYAPQATCESLGGKYYDCNDKTKTNCPVGKKSACLLETSKYVPLCSKIVQGEIPWAQRLKSSPFRVFDYLKELFGSYSNSFSKYYSLGLSGTPFGAINVGSDSIASTSIVFAGSSPIEDGKFGFPYSCNDGGKKSWLSSKAKEVDNCTLLYFDNKVKMATPTSTAAFYDSLGTNGQSYLNHNNSSYYIFSTLLKNLWLKVSTIKGGVFYDNSSTGNNPIPLVENTRTPDTKYQAVKPAVTNISVSSLFSSGVVGAQSKIPATTDASGNTVYKITKSGFYSVSFNTKVDAEQSPIKKLVVRIKNTIDSKDQWTTGSSIIELNNIDPMPNANNPHKVVRYLQADEYYVLIKLEDNWGFYQCLGLKNIYGTSSGCDECCTKSSGNFTSGKCSNCK